LGHAIEASLLVGREFSSTFGDVEGNRRGRPVELVGQGFQQFLLRGIDKVQAEWSRVCACHNLLKIFRVVGSVPT
jgi:hypothetical protein